MRRNQLRCLPDNIGDLSKLDTIYLESNQLDENGLPDSFAELESLKGLPLHKNRFTTIPSSVFALVNLEELYVWRVEGGEWGNRVTREMRATRERATRGLRCGFGVAHGLSYCQARPCVASLPRSTL